MTKMGAPILALDVASEFGWAEGPIGGTPISGTARFAPKGSSRAAVFAGAIQWAADRFAVSRPRAIWMEVPNLHGIAKGKSSVDVMRMLLGLPAIIEGVALRRGIYTIKTCSAADVRHYFLGQRNIPGDQAKRLVCQRCDALGWSYSDHNAADALALWAYACEKEHPGSMPALMPLWTKGAPTWASKRA